MHPTVALRTFPLFLSLLFSVCPVVHSQDTAPASQAHDKNGQNGTPNLPIAPSRLVDWTHFGSAVDKGSHFYLAEANLVYFLGKYRDKAIQSQPDPRKLAAYTKKITGLIRLIQSNSVEPRLPDQADAYSGFASLTQSKALYIGVDVRGGSGQTGYTAPAISYTDAAIGLELGADYLTEGGSNHVPNSFAFSVKGDITDQDRALARLLRRGYSKLKALSDAPSEAQSYAPTVASRFQPTSLLEPDPFQTISQFFTGRHPFGWLPVQHLKELLNAISAYKADVARYYEAQGKEDVYKTLEDLPGDYISKTKEFMLSALAGNRYFSDGSSLSDAGLTASVLLSPFREGRPGITLLYAVQDFQDDPIHFARSNAVRNGVALILQDRTPAQNPDYITKLKQLQADPDDFQDFIPDPLLPSWKFKLGLEYIAPLLGLTKTYDGFVRYRDPNSYSEITLTYGEDGLGKDYGDITIGRSFTF